MERVLKATRARYLGLLICMLMCLDSASATTALIPADDHLIIGARAIVRGKVLSIRSAHNEREDRIYTYISLRVQEVLKGSITERKVVIKELGGQVGDRGFTVYGNAQYTVGESVLLYLDTWADGSLRTYQMFLGKFNITVDPKTGRQVVERGAPDSNTSVIQHAAHAEHSGGTVTDRSELSAYRRMVRSRIEATLDQAQRFEEAHYANIALLAEPSEYRSVINDGDILPQFTFLSPSTPPRWFEPDSGAPVIFYVKPDNYPFGSAAALSDMAAAMNAWSVVSGSSLRVSSGGAIDQCYTGLGVNGIVFDNCDGRNSPSPGCSGILAWGGCGWSGQTRVVNGVTFYKASGGFVSFNPYASCNFDSSCIMQEIGTHEVGHALGFGHSQDNTATMAAFAHFDGRCASLRDDDMNGARFIYPPLGGGPGPLAIQTTSLANGTTGSSYNQTLIATGGTPSYIWSRVSGTLPAGLTLNANGSITGTPTTAATSNFRVRVTDSAAPAATAERDFSITITQATQTLNSQFVSQSVPTSLQPGQTFTANMKFINTGTTSWNGGGVYWLVSQNPPLNQTWGGNGVLLDSFFVGPNQQLDVTFSARAPQTPGTYNFQWQMYQNDGVGFFGQVSPNVVIQVGSAPAVMPDTVGVFRPSNGALYLKNANSTGFADMFLTYGLPGDYPVTGDWNGDGIATIGVYRDGTFHLRNSNTNGFADIVFAYGASGDQPVVGDWDGDGVDTIGVYRGGTFMLRNSNTSGPPEMVFELGVPGDVGIAGDWDGNGVDTTGVFRPTNGALYLKNANSTGFADIVLTYGLPGDKPVTGDWNGDGVDTIGVYRDGTFHLRNTNTNGFADIVFSLGMGEDYPIAGDWNGLP